MSSYLEKVGRDFIESGRPDVGNDLVQKSKDKSLPLSLNVQKIRQFIDTPSENQAQIDHKERLRLALHAREMYLYGEFPQILQVGIDSEQSQGDLAIDVDGTETKITVLKTSFKSASLGKLSSFVILIQNLGKDQLLKEKTKTGLFRRIRGVGINVDVDDPNFGDVKEIRTIRRDERLVTTGEISHDTGRNIPNDLIQRLLLLIEESREYNDALRKNRQTQQPA